MPCVIKMEKKIRILVNASFSKNGKFSDVPALKHITLTEPTPTSI